MIRLLHAAACLLIVLAPRPATGEEALVAVAANFAETMEAIETGFEALTGDRLTVASGSTGKLYAQIVNGAPYDVFLAADQARPERLAGDGLGVPETRFTYAVGRLALWSADPARIPAGDGRAAIAAASYRKLAFANPALAPYGEAARQTLESLGLWTSVQDRFVMGENVGQTFAMVATGNAELGFVALSQVQSPRNATEGSRWDVPPELHDPIRQDAILLRHGEDNAAARAFLRFLHWPETQALITRFGYGTE